MLARTSLLIPSPRSSVLFVSYNATLAMLATTVPHPAASLPRCGVPRKTTSLVRFAVDSDLCRAFAGNKLANIHDFSIAFTYMFKHNAAKAMSHEDQRFLQASCQLFLLYLVAEGM